MSSQATPKTGPTERMRAWMVARKRPWTVIEMCDAMDAAGDAQRNRVRRLVLDFIRRLEVIPLGPSGTAGKRNRRQNYFTYNRRYRRLQRGVIVKKVWKAMYISTEWTVSDIQRLAGGAPNYVTAVVNDVRKRGYLGRVGRRVKDDGTGTERVYRLADRDRFRREVMG